MTHSPDAVLKAYSNGKISRREADVYLRKIHGVTLKQARRHPRNKRTAAILVLSLVAFFALLGIDALTPTGYATYSVDVTNDTFVISQKLTSLRVSGEMIGEGMATIVFDAGEESYLVASIENDASVPRTAKLNYKLGDIVEIENLIDGKYYLEHEDSVYEMPVPFLAPPTSATLVIVNETSNVTLYRVPVLVGDTPRTYTFQNVCADTCVLPGVNGTLRVKSTANIKISLLGEMIGSNRPPKQSTAFPNVTLNDTYIFDLNEYFEDPDGDELVYRASASTVAAITVERNILTISPVGTGEEEIVIHASDLDYATQAKMVITNPGHVIITHFTLLNSSS